jgi:integrin-linked kinase-associated serine/threonine phosphatase 2C
VFKGTGLVAWLGDARCVLARKGKDVVPDMSDRGTQKLNAFALSKDHKAVILKEKQRIEKVTLQPVVKPILTSRCSLLFAFPPFSALFTDAGAQAGGFVSDGRVCGIMEVSRSIGDAALKSKGVSSVPDTQRIALTQVCNILSLNPKP